MIIGKVKHLNSISHVAKPDTYPGAGALMRWTSVMLVRTRSLIIAMTAQKLLCNPTFSFYSK